MDRRQVRRPERRRVDQAPSPRRTAARRLPSLRRRQVRERAERKLFRHRIDEIAHRQQNFPLRLRISHCSRSEDTTRSSRLLSPRSLPLRQPPTPRSRPSLSFLPRPPPCSNPLPRRIIPIHQPTTECSAGPSRRRRLLEATLRSRSHSTSEDTGRELRWILSGVPLTTGVRSLALYSRFVADTHLSSQLPDSISTPSLNRSYSSGSVQPSRGHG